MNCVILVGNVGRDPQSFRGGVCTFSLATTEGKDAVEWHKVVCFKQQADFASKYIKKGSMVTVEGRLSYSKYTKNGQDLVQAEIIADRVSFIGQLVAPAPVVFTPQNWRPKTHVDMLHFLKIL